MKITPYSKNAKKHPKEQIEKIANSIREFGFNQPIVVDKNGVIIVGHGRFEAGKFLGMKQEDMPIKVVDLTEEQAKSYRLADNKLNESDWDMDLVLEELAELSIPMIELSGFDPDLLTKEEQVEELKRSLQEDYIVPPFSIWDTKQAYWQNRKKDWIKFIGDSGEGRDEALLGEGLNKLARMQSEDTSLTGTSIFDPVVAELSYKWFCPEKGDILDPFSGGHVRGTVAGFLGYGYTGIDLSKKQIDVNKRKVKELEVKAEYIHGNSKDLDKLVKGTKDFIFSCPPYYDLEEYNDGEGDLSMMATYEDFIKDYREIIKKAVDKLKDNRFAVWVVGDVRDKDGYYYGFVNDTIKAFTDAGMKLYNEIILANAIATAPMRARRPFDSNRKVTKVHQNILCFYKGDGDQVPEFYGKLPKIEKAHGNVMVFYKGDIEEIKKNYKVISKDEIDFGVDGE